MRLRKLKYEDIPYMLEWMHDSDITYFLKANFSKSTEESQKGFIDNSFNENNVNFAIVEDDKDEYLGSISLKNINKEDQNAEYAICLRKNSIGKDIATKATTAILKYAFNELKLNRVYLNVVSENIRACKFYEKYGFIYEGEFKEAINIKGKICNLKWYRILKKEFEEGEHIND